MRLTDLLNRACPDARLIGDIPDVRVEGITSDSRKVGENWLFVAYRGSRVDGHSFVLQAFEAGACAAVVEQPVGDAAPLVVVKDTRRAMAALQSKFWGRPQDSFTTVGLTGTNGKTTTTYLLEAILRQAGRKPGIIGTVEARYAGHREKSVFTTPDPELLFPLLARMRDAGVDTVVMEVSSHALALGRVAELSFDAALLTNFTQDHLDFHGTMDGYAQAKSLLFTHYLRGRAAAWARTERLWDIIPGELHPLLYDLHLGESVTLYPDSYTLDINGIHGSVAGIPFSSPLIGQHNVLNILGAVAVAEILGVSPDLSLPAVSDVTVPGRLERVAGPVPVFVDYAHTPDALSRAQAALRPLVKGRLITVFGAGGDRDRAKRPLMGRAVWEGSDVAVVTSDNPRTEDPEAIIRDILEGIPEKASNINKLHAGFRGVVTEPDRRTAIRAAILAASEDDAVLIAGKGHEDYQILGTTRIHFDDREEAAEALKSWTSFV